MKKIISFLALIAAGRVMHAQTHGPVFKVPADYNYAYKVRIDLGKSNSLTVFLSDLADLPRLSNLDSLVSRCLIDLAPLKDSMSDPTAQYYVDHFSDALGIRKISLRRTPDTENSFLVMNGELAAIKSKQDTVRMLGLIPHPPKLQSGKQSNGDRYYEFVFSVNKIEDLQQVSLTEINDRLRLYADNKNRKWQRNWGEGLNWKLAKDNNITGDRQGGGAHSSRDYLSLNLAVSVQNYKNYFSPGVNLGVYGNFSNAGRSWMHVVGVGWEPMYLFAKNTEGKLQSYRNDFISLTYGQRPVENKDPLKETSFTGIGSLGWLYYRQGDLMEKNTFRLSFGRFSWHKTNIDPLFYFHDLFKGITPGIRIVQSF